VPSGVLVERIVTGGAAASGAERAIADRRTGAQCDKWRVDPSGRGASGVKAGANGGGKAPTATGVATVPGDLMVTAAAEIAATAATSVSATAVAGRRVRRAGTAGINR